MLTSDHILMGAHETPKGAADGDEDLIAQRVVSLRKARKLTLQECARLSGVAASTLSKIERRELSPTISTLQKIAAGFSIELTELVAPNREAFAAGRRAVCRKGEGRAHTSATCANSLLCGELKDKRMVPVRTVVTARAPEDYQVWARHDSEIFLVVLTGKMLLHSRVYEPLELSEGDSVYYDGGSEHCWTSVGDEDAEVIWVMSS